MLRQLITQLGRHPVEVLAGLLLVVFGVVLTVAGAAPTGQPYLLYLGSVGTAFGGIVLSWTVGKAVSKEEALQEVRAQLGLVSNTLGQAAGQMSRVVDQCADNSMPAETGFALVGQSATLVGAQVAVIQGILGKPFEAGELLSTLAEMENLAERLDRREKRENGPGTLQEVVEVKSRLQELRAELTGLVGSRGRVSEVAPCPKCGRETTASLGPYPGDTAAVVCSHCHTRYNAHRRSDGSVFSRPMGNGMAELGVQPQADKESVSVTHACPKCEQEVRVMTKLSDGPRKFAVCLNCGTSLIFDLKNDVVTSDGEFEIEPSVEIVGRYGSGGSGARPIVRCSSCEGEMRAMIRTPKADHAIDNKCRKLFVVPHDSFLEWRKQHEPDTISHVGDSSSGIG